MAPTNWRIYEKVARDLIDKFREEFGLSKVEGKQTLAGKSGTKWVIDAKGVRELDGATIVIECRRYTTSRQKQEAVGGIAYKIRDMGASGGIHVSPLGLQEGARKIAAAENVVEVTLNEEASVLEFEMRFLDRLLLGLSDDLLVKPTDEMRLSIFQNGTLISDEEIHES